MRLGRLLRLPHAPRGPQPDPNPHPPGWGPPMSPLFRTPSRPATRAAWTPWRRHLCRAHMLPGGTAPRWRVSPKTSGVCRRTGRQRRITGLGSQPRPYMPVSACRPRSVIISHVTVSGRPPACAVPDDAVANPSSTKRRNVSTVKPCASMIAWSPSGRAEAPAFFTAAFVRSAPLPVCAGHPHLSWAIVRRQHRCEGGNPWLHNTAFRGGTC
jgi:hypothetical protein